MRKFLIFVLTISVVFGVTVRIGEGVVVYTGDGLLSFRDVIILTKAVSEFLGYDVPKLSKKDDLIGLYFNRKTLIYDGKKIILTGRNVEAEKVDVKILLDFFNLPYEKVNEDYIIPECVIVNITKNGGVFTVSYYGNPAFVYKVISDVFSVISTGYVKYLGDIFSPGDMLFSQRVGKMEISKLEEESNMDIIVLTKKVFEKKIFIYPYGSTLVKPLPPKNLGVLVAKGEGSVVVRPHTAELEGLEDEFVEYAYNIGTKLAEKMGYKFEIFPAAGLLPGSSYVLILLKDVKDYELVKKLLKELTGIEKVVDFVTDFNILPDLSPNDKGGLHR